MLRVLEDEEVDVPILSVVNLNVLFVVVTGIGMGVMGKNPLDPFSAADVTGIENPGKESMGITVKRGEERSRYESTGEIGEGGGVKAGITYRLPDGRMVYVPEGSSVEAAAP